MLRPVHSERPHAAQRACPREGTHRAPGVGRLDARAVGPRAARRWAGQRSRGPRRGTVGRGGAVAGGDRLGRGRTPQAGRDRRRAASGGLTGSAPGRDHSERTPGS